MHALSRRFPTRGYTLVELIVALVLGTVALSAAAQVFLATQRFFRLQASALEVHEGLRAAMQVLTVELRELDPSGGDIVALGPDSISIRATRGLEFVCAPPDPSSGRMAVRTSLSSGYRDVDPARDRALVFRDGDPTTEDDDAWLDFGIASAGGAATCSDGAAASELRLVGAVGALDSVGLGAPVRWYERAVYRLYADETGAWWLGVRGWSGGAWAALSPVAGPLRHPLGLQLTYYDATGAATAEPTRVARIALVVRGVGTALLQATGGRQEHWSDSLVTVVFPRNGRR
ncbi:MAG TPA: prepilin-type N-terminal cleavage/methylation domain-containing protein [Gemmatimonadales bacterium]|nr:prepilin-type N-terminal cleavage/methylation domain-containing protein [Gemmatimonadales bacterium]